MTGKTRGSFLIAGSIIAFIGFLIPGLYGVSYNPPANSAAAHIVLSKLPGFGSAVALNTANAGVYNGFGGPIHDALSVTLISIIVTGALGLLAPFIPYDRGLKQVEKHIDLARNVLPNLPKNVHSGLSVISELGIVGGIIWQFRSGGMPSQITQNFIADLGGGQVAIDASHYLSASLGFGFLILFFGFLVGSVGAYTRFGCFLLVGFCLLFGVALLYTRITTGVW
jgi:hypothetical protein